ncbi:hypothetical protein AALP_AA1G342900 [Arabis alpina]|uniref:Ternary complex factor MIP1 leucine-zipper domain-containing protein n=1 Tax=Arabis alpina TaxID=50452 RepID=A0A087HSJ2_ARAAL|nr:hypothetical protein AALP_AA1G342900 [Arabis alpina]
MPSKNDRFSYSSSSFSSSSSSSQLTTPRAFQNLASPRLSSQARAISPSWDDEKPKCSNGCLMPKSKEELRREITELDTEILRLEQYILSLYRTSFGDLLHELFLDDSLRCLKTPLLKPFTAKFHNDRVSSFSEMEDNKKRSESGNPSLADLLGLNTPNKLSEEY